MGTSWIGVYRNESGKNNKSGLVENCEAWTGKPIKLWRKEAREESYSDWDSSKTGPS
jgi:hypothetical protein